MSGGSPKHTRRARTHVSPRPVVVNGWGFSGHAGFTQRAGESTARGRLYRIEGETLPVSAIAERLGVSVRSAQRRMQLAKAGSGPVTWEALR